jgi:hypothetical protein
MRQIPDGPKDLTCPFRGKSMDRVCKSCPLWVHIRGKDKNTGEDCDSWNCSLAWLPALLIETAHQARSGAAATESFRNEMVKQNEAARVIPLGQIGQSIEAYKRLALPNGGSE